jgi:hypothetical protein
LLVHELYKANQLLIHQQLFCSLRHVDTPVPFGPTFILFSHSKDR